MAGLKLEERLIAKRMSRLIYLGVLIIGSGLLFGLCHQKRASEILVMCMIDVLFAALGILYLENDRLHKGTESDTAEDYQRTALCFTIAMVAAFVASFFPPYTSPVLIITFLLSTALDREKGLFFGLFLAGQIALSGQGDIQVLSCYLVLVLFGSVMTDLYKVKENRKYTKLIVLSVSLALPTMFYYLQEHSANVLTLVFSFVSGMLGVFGIHFLFERLYFRQSKSEEISLDTIVDKNYHFVQEMQKKSPGDYQHALRTSRIAAHCASCVGAKVKVAAVGGFYYRLGRLEGEPMVENGIHMAEDHCFPREVIVIISEYNGEKYPISTIESAIVHITDSLVTKFERMDQNTLSSSWNRDMVIYQTLNEKSSSGIYDDSGLTMNQFIKIREFLAKEEKLL